ncbi:uncharacterized protein PGTG_03533 [Puccinia graminis f. sp. tritici CRL 75-36-700-3]|uniref:TNFR-Cys domain-containing protein n=1 Tax=Puccinia graminis f. sp. tritici (strain CRL 75-36-700-3 / race SCCL) TaxID=418459 RepID=E3JZV2_PUCGT|nr:uncharacterized protein PGTG_03533 [Puccinia graminis f. sp. tritici CRL 75-36-700-3]EFP77577.1 hypothetical protein PGTG_03533 [Puccinia graminis f. sp. tritici CRL 75-36-700-3]
MLLRKINVLVLLLSCLTSAHGYDPPLCPKCHKNNSSYLPRNYDKRPCNTVTKCNHHGDCLPCTEMVPYQNYGEFYECTPCSSHPFLRQHCIKYNICNVLACIMFCNIVLM